MQRSKCKKALAARSREKRRKSLSPAFVVTCENLLNIAVPIIYIQWAQKDSNLRPMDYESTALTAELRALQVITC